MVQWQNPTVEARLEVIDTNIVFLLLGLYGWEYIQTLDVEYAVTRGRLSFRWPLIPYVVGRLSQFVSLLLASVNLPTMDFTCLPGTMSTAVAADIAMGCNSTNLMIRTWVIWKGSRLVHALLLVFALGHWTVLALDVANIRSYQVDEQCNAYLVHPEMNADVFLYTLCYDFVVLLLCFVGLSTQSSKSPFIKRLQVQGLLYFVVAVVTYIPPTVFTFLNVDTMLSIMGHTALTANTIVSCRAVRSLLGFHPSYPSSLSEECVKDSNMALTTQIPISVREPLDTC